MIGTCVKYIFFVFNILCLIFGFATLLVGIWINLDVSSFVGVATDITERENIAIDEDTYGMIEEFTEQSVIKDFSNILVAVGVFVIILSFLGCYGSIREYRCLLVVYGLLLLILIMGQIGGAIKVIDINSPTSTFNVHLKSTLKSTIREEYSNNQTNSITTLWNYAMEELQCCGVESYKDFGEAKYFSQKEIPEACCKSTSESIESCTDSPTLDNSNKDKGCFPIFVEWVQNHLIQIVGLLLAIAAFELLAIVSAVIVCKKISGDLSGRRSSDQYTATEYSNM